MRLKTWLQLKSAAYITKENTTKCLTFPYFMMFKFIILVYPKLNEFFAKKKNKEWEKIQRERKIVVAYVTKNYNSPNIRAVLLSV
jgi:hypothetical protein